MYIRFVDYFALKYFLLLCVCAPHYFVFVISMISTVKNIRSVPVGRSWKSLVRHMASKTFILEYEYVQDIIEKRTPFRAEHLALANDYVDKKMCVGGGPFADASGALFVFQGENDDFVETFVESDPYVSNGLVLSYSVRELTVGLGKLG